jgi:hypothetical protein
MEFYYFPDKQSECFQTAEDANSVHIEENLEHETQKINEALKSSDHKLVTVGNSVFLLNNNGKNKKKSVVDI